MGRIHVVTDSASDLPLEIRKELDISVVPLTVQFGDDIFRDGESISTGEFYNKLKVEKIMPSTCQPSPADFVKVYEEIAKPGDTIISIHLSSKMSGTYQSAVLASTMLDSGITVKTIDTKTASLGTGLITLEAAKAVQAQETVEDILEVVQHAIDFMQVYFVVDTLEYLQKNGRIGMASALVGTLLNIKPILTVDNGMVAPFEKSRGKNNALRRLLELGEVLVRRYPEQRFRVGISNSESQEEAERLSRSLQEVLPVDGDILISQMGPTIGVHTGPGVVALFILPV
ncbi:MAG: DegV family protein [Bacillota bacterium]|nr:DegV family protein [Bacillota bacterium]